MLARQTHLKPSSYRPVESAWRDHVLPAWGKVAIADIQKTAVQQWVSDMTLGDPGAVPARKPKGATLVIRAYGVLAAILDDAVSDNRTLRNPARGVALPRKVKKPHVYLSHDQVHELAAASKYPALVGRSYWVAGQASGHALTSSHDRRERGAGWFRD